MAQRTSALATLFYPPAVQPPEPVSVPARAGNVLGHRTERPEPPVAVAEAIRQHTDLYGSSLERPREHGARQWQAKIRRAGTMRPRHRSAVAQAHELSEIPIVSQGER